MNCEHFAPLIEDYVTGELPDDEALALDTHLALCATCRRALAEMEEAAAIVWLTVPQIEPPAALRSQVLSLAHETRTTLAGPPASRSLPQPTRRWWTNWRWSPSTAALVLSSLAIAISVGMGAWSLSLQSEVSRQLAENQRLSRQVAVQWDALYVLMSPTRTERPLAGGEAAPQARGMVYLDPTRRQGMVIATHLPPPDDNQSYQVWLRGPDRIVSVGLLRFDEHGTAYLVVESPTAFDEFQAVGVSLEPAGGSPQPTGPRMLAGTLS